MNFLSFVLVVLAFLVGCFFGNEKEMPIKRVKTETDNEILKLQEEYENFLNYDGTEQ